MVRENDALEYHRRGRRGKIEVVPTKPVETQRDLSLAYSPGVAEPARAIHEDARAVDRYTARRNLVAVVSNGTAVLGLGDVGPLAAKPVMEGKAVLFKKYADIDVFDIEVKAHDPDQFVEVVAALEPTFGGINLEDIAAPACFHVEEALERRLDIPVFHDDQHGTAIISAAALLNAAELQEKELADLRVTCVGAGAAAIGSMRLWTTLGVRHEHITLYDLDGVIREDRPGLDAYRAAFARPTDDPRRSLSDVIEGADVLIGLSAGGIVTQEMVRRMADRPIIFALANPDPEIRYEDAVAARPDAIVGTGRSDYPNQVNNVLGFPYLFRGALDVAASHIDEAMKLAAARALARLAREGVTDDVLAAYGGEPLKFGPEYIIPKPVDARSLYWVAPAVAEAAMDGGVARERVDLEAYRLELARKLSPTREVMWHVTNVARRSPRRIVFPEGEVDAILRAAEIVKSEGIAEPVLLGRPAVMRETAASLGLDLDGVELVDSEYHPELERYADELFRLRCRRGMTRVGARCRLKSRIYQALMMVHCDDAEGVVSGWDAPYPDTIRPVLQIIGVREGVRRASGCYLVITKNDVKLLADTTINIEPDAETLAETAILTAGLARHLGIRPRIALLSFSNFGDAPHPSSERVARAVEIVREREPDLMIDGEMQADVALNEAAREPYPFSSLEGSANVLVFPSLDAGNIAYKLLRALGSDVVGPIVMGVRKPVNVLQQGASVSTIVHMTSLTVAHAIRLSRGASL
ncbi:MAG TPA: NADP-dependent malic enzyme [Sandaracinaceae bacterium LLY-WYZ-13_1]|nr:NADP-dependent malic enzyme [Sandaracinaceae bacterium LLY-WYZ-13_1]